MYICDLQIVISKFEICDLLQEKVFFCRKRKFLGERAKVPVFPFFRFSHPLPQHLEAKRLQIEFFKFYHVKEGTFSEERKKKDFSTDK